MAQFSAITVPHIYTYGYSAIPLRVKDADASDTEQYKYVINILFNKLTVSSVQTAQLDGNVYTKVNFTTAHSYKLGDVIFLNQASGYYTDYYTVMSNASTTSIIIDLEIGSTLTGTTTVANVLKYKLSPDPDGEAKLDLSNTIKDFVTENLLDAYEIYPASDTKFEYDLLVGYEGKALYEFSDNAFQSGNVGFVASGLTATTQVQFNIGDQIIIEQDLYSWPYIDNFYSLGRVGFTGNTQHYFTAADTVTVTGQITHSSYNGESGLYSTQSGTIPGENNIVLNKSWLGSSPVEPGVIYGIITPEYNTTATITNIVFSAGIGVIIVTDVPWAGSSPAIGGTIKHTDGRIISSYNHLSITGMNAYNSYVNQLNYSINGFDPYVIQSRSSSLNNISTILNNTDSYRIEASSKSFLLAHNYALSYAVKPIYTWKDINGNTLGVSYLSGATTTDFYFPVGLNQVYQSTNRTDSTPLSSILGSISSYSVGVASSTGSVRTNYVNFDLSDDCSTYEIYHLMWKDALGSWISYPFKYISQDSMDVDRKNYYRTAGNWDNGTFDYNSFDRGEKSFFVRSRDKIKLNSGWVNESENFLIKDLMQSANVYIQDPNNILIACTIDNKEITFGKADSEQIFQYTIDIITSNNEIRL